MKVWITRIDRLTEATGRAASWLILGMVAVTFLVALLRYLFNIGWIWMQESVTYLHALLFLLAIPYALKTEGHVRVDLFYRPATPRTKAWIDLAGTLLLLFPFCGLILFHGWGYAADSWRIFEGSGETGGIPGLFLIKSMVVVMPLLLILQGLSQASKAWLVLLGEES
ncbi:MAG: TRAP transporter small permease subunit [bacterium]|nr:TRAP transporter small permease subunit [bacterium]